MGITRLPKVTLMFCALALMLQALPQGIQNLLYFDRSLATVAPLDFLTLISAHWIHADWSHLAWNLGALGILGTLLEQHSRRLLLAAIIAGTVGVNALLLSPLATIEQYCGMSGLLNTLLGAMLYQAWRQTRSPLVVTTLLLCLGKMGFEVFSQQALFTNISWPPYAPAHVAGLIATPLALYLAKAMASKNTRNNWVTAS